MSAFWRIVLTIASVLFFGWISLVVSGIGEDGIWGGLEVVNYLQCGMLATILIYLVSDRIARDKSEEKKKDKDETKKEKE